MKYRSLIWAVLLLVGEASVSAARLRTGLEPLTPVGPGTLIGSLDPALRKWYIPQDLYEEYRWEGWEYSNYARERYERYTDIRLEGESFYDMYGNYITKGWTIFDWTQEQPGQYGSQLYKNPRYRNWFANVLISAVSKGEYYTAVTVGEEIRTALTPLTFSKPAFNGMQWDFLSDKYAFTALASRISIPSWARPDDDAPGSDLTHFTNFFGFRGTVQLGDFTTLGATYVNAHHGNSAVDFGTNSFKGILSGPRNTGNVTDIVILLSDDSPEDGVGGAVLYSEQILIDGQRVDIKPFVEGGVRRAGLLEASGSETIKLKYDVKSFADYDYKLIKKIEFVLVLANDYRVEVTSNLQTNTSGEPVFLPVTRAEGNVKDGSNQRFVRFQYGLPTGNEIYGVTLEVTDVDGFSLRAEYDVNRRFRRFPNQNYRSKDDQALATGTSSAFYVTASKLAYPWFAYGEAFSMDYDYATSMVVGSERGSIDYEDVENYAFEFVDDNDDQDRYQDWDRVSQPAFDREVFPGLDENNDLVSDFNQNDNLQPDYEEPFLKYNVDPPEFLFGMDMNNNAIIDRFENDNLADYPYKKDHRGYNVYGGAEIVPNVKLTLGLAEEWLLSADKKAQNVYGMFTMERSFPGLGKLQVFDMAKLVKDKIPDDLYQWVQPPLSTGTIQFIADPMLMQNTFVNTTYLGFDFTKFRNLNSINKVKYERFDQRDPEKTGRKDSWSLGIINKMDYHMPLGKNFVLRPKWKSMYRRDTAEKGTPSEVKELSEIGFLILKYAIYKTTWIELGVEGTLFYNLVEEPTMPTPAYVDDFTGTVLGVQFSNTSDYLGYQFTSNVGFRWERKAFEDVSEVNTTAFLKMFAGAQD